MNEAQRVEKIKEKARQLGAQMNWLKLEDDDNHKRVIILDTCPDELKQELLAITFQVSKDTMLSTDSVYRFTMEALDTIADSGAETLEDLRESLYEQEADIDTSSLTEWLNESNYHVEYLTEASQEYGSINGFQLLALAQQKGIEDAANTVYTILTEEDE